MCALKVDSEPPVSKGTLHCRLDGVDILKSAVFDINTGNLFVKYFGPESCDPSSSDFEKSHLGVWSVKDGVVSKSHTVINIHEDLQPTMMTIVDVGSKQTLLLRTESKDGIHLWETNFLSGGKDLVKPIDVSKIGWSNFHNRSWKNLLFVSADTLAALHVFKDLEYQSKMSIPEKSEATLFDYSFSDEYAAFILRSPGSRKMIYAYRWSPEKLSIGDFILGPLEGCIFGDHARLSPHHIVTNIFTDEEYVRLQRLAIYNIEEKSVSHFLLQDQDETEHIQLVIELTGKALVVLGRGSVFELN